MYWIKRANFNFNKHIRKSVAYWKVHNFTQERSVLWTIYTLVSNTYFESIKNI